MREDSVLDMEGKLAIDKSRECPSHTNIREDHMGWSESCSVTSDSLQVHGLYSPWNSLGQSNRVGSLSLLQGIFPIQESNQGLLHCRQIRYQLSYQGSPVE